MIDLFNLPLDGNDSQLADIHAGVESNRQFTKVANFKGNRPLKPWADDSRSLNDQTNSGKGALALDIYREIRAKEDPFDRRSEDKSTRVEDELLSTFQTISINHVLGYRPSEIENCLIAPPIHEEVRAKTEIGGHPLYLV